MILWHRTLVKRALVAHSVLIAWALWSLYSISTLLSVSASDQLVYSYMLYLALCGLSLWLSRIDILAPIGVFTLIVFSGFGLNIPFIAADYFPRIRIQDDVLNRVLAVVMIAQSSFSFGAMLPARRFNPLNLVVRTKWGTKGVGVVVVIVLIGVVAFAGYVRMRFHLGEAGVQPEIPYAGYIQYLLYNGTLLLCIWVLTQGLRQNRIYTVLGLILLLGVAVTQALLGWRSGIVVVLILAFVPFWYQFRLYTNQRQYSMAWLVVLVIVGSSIIQLGNSIRYARLGGESATFAKSGDEFLRKIMTRSQGTTRLAAVIQHFGKLTMTNDELIYHLHSQDLTAREYIDRTLYRVKIGQSHSVGTSGPGGPYVAFGLLGVVGAYVIAGIIMGFAYASIADERTNSSHVLGVVLYASLIVLLFEIVNENYGINSAKTIGAILTQVFVLKLLLRKSSSGRRVAT